MERKKKVHLANKALNQAMADFHHPNIPDPTITTKKRKKPLKVDEVNWQVELSVHQDLSLNEKDLMRYYRFLWRIGISYYLVCPYDMNTAVKITSSAISGSNKEIGETITNLFIELIVEYFLARTFPEDTFWFWNREREIQEKFFPKKEFRVIFTLILELLLEQEIFPQKFHKEISEREKSLAKKIASIIRRGGVLKQSTWMEKVKEMAKVFFESSRKKNVRKIEHPFHRDIKKNSLIKAFVRGGGEITETKKGKIAEIIYQKTEGDPGASASSLYSTGSVKSPKEAARYWYRARATNIMEMKLEGTERGEKISFRGLPENWKLGDPIEKLDLLLSLSTFPIIIPNITTKKWKNMEKSIREEKSFPPNMLLLIDSSNSMYYPPEGSFPSPQKRRIKEWKMKQLNINYPYKSKLDLSIVASFAALKGALSRNCDIAAINFSGNYEMIDWTKNRKKIEDVLLKFRGDGTKFPVKPFKKLLKKTGTKTLIVIITDSAIYNEKETAHVLSKAAENNHLYLFKIGESEKGKKIIEKVREAGGEVITLHDLTRLIQLVGEKTKGYYAL